MAGDAPYVWRPDPRAIASARVSYSHILEVEDTNVDLPDRAFDAVAHALACARAADERVLLFCAAGLKRSPHLLYGVLRQRGLTPERAWEAVRAARPFVEPFQPYVAAAERWAAQQQWDS